MSTQPPPGNSGSGSAVNLTRVVQVMAVIGNVLLAVTGIVGLATAGTPGALTFSGSVSPVNVLYALFFFSIGLVIFGILGILGELAVKVYIDTFAVFAYYWTKGLWYLVMGFFAIGVAGILGIVTGFYLWLICILMFVMFFLTRSS
eukprot:TRINITY_DN1328_c0_g2_i1.p2 TRINITY_DN1328_c0_g2~~TRINITY_DN1328_c0_g2_i1.p2  ORF type:complete len:146 (+),score=15.09 TRINITY_DN1328_c0_g2_i1:23-460(+)